MQDEPTLSYGKGSCLFCGNSPTNHFFAYINNTSFVVGNKLTERQPIKFLFSRSSSLFDFVFLEFEKFFFHTFCFFGFAKKNTNIALATNLRSRMIWLEAARRGISMEQFVIFGKATDWYRASIAGQWHYFVSVPIPSHFRIEDAYWIDDKSLLKDKLKVANIPTSRSVTVTRETNALEIFDSMEKPVIIKPRSGSRGRHTTTFITKKEDLLLAFGLAKQLGYFVQIEEHLLGNVCRATVVAGVLRGFLQSESPKIVGDGKSSIRELIDEKNKNKPDKIGNVDIQEEHIEFIRRQGYMLLSILPQGVILPLLSRTGRLFGGRSKEMAKGIHPNLRTYLEKAATIIGVPLVGFDLIIPNPEEDPDTQKWGIIEANSLPFIDLHEFAYEGEPANVASYIWDLWRDVPEKSV